MQSPHEPWFYPRNYSEVLRVVGGAAPVRREHSDREAFKPWTGVSPPPPLSASTNALLAADNRDTEFERKGSSGIVGDKSALER
jgi:hypothetical protein